MLVYVVIPVFNEAENVEGLVRELSALDLDHHLVVDFVDDSHNTDTVDAIKKAQQDFPSLDINYYHRSGGDRTHGLAGAVIAGMHRAISANASHMVVMDGDGQHPPSVIPAMLSKITYGNHLVVASRYAPGGSREGLDGPYRQLISRSATWVAKFLFPIRLRSVSDPMTGLFVVQIDSIETENIQATGFKILLEILLRSPKIQIAEVPVVFRNRAHGDSKASTARGVEYLLQLTRLRLTNMKQAATQQGVEFEQVAR